ncbi:RNA polymerase sigma factor [Moorella sp. E308F]|nr:RNA polymerase sigma factor [Moorella sp. E308F]
MLSNKCPGNTGPPGVFFLNLGSKKAPGKKNGAVSFEELVLTYQDRVYNLSYQLTGNHTDAQDLAQEVFVRAYMGLDKFRYEADPGTWLHRITVNLFLNLRRKIARHPAVSLDAPLDTGEGEVTREVAAAGGDPQELVEDMELRGFVRSALRQLPAEYQAVLVLRELQGYSYEEIASLLGCPPGTVKSRLNRARQAMREKVTQMAEEKPPEHRQP